MARRRKERPAKKFGTPLYCAVWPTGNYAFVGGGGGKSSSGIANKYSPLLYYLLRPMHSEFNHPAWPRHGCGTLGYGYMHGHYLSLTSTLTWMMASG